MSDRFARFWAGLSMAVGLVVLIVGVTVSLVLPFVIPLAGFSATLDRPLELAARVLLAVALLLVTTLLSAPLILAGQVLMVLLDIRRSTRRIRRRLRRRPRPERAPERGLVDRLRPR